MRSAYLTWSVPHGTQGAGEHFSAQRVPSVCVSGRWLNRSFGVDESKRKRGLERQNFGKAKNSDEETELLYWERHERHGRRQRLEDRKGNQIEEWIVLVGLERLFA